MSDWSYSRHSRNKPRLLGQLKAEYVYLNLCADHSFLSPNRDVIENRLDNRTGKMKELRESLRQAALINIVAAVNDGDKPEISTFSATSQDDLTNGSVDEIIDFTELVTDSSVIGTGTTGRTSYRINRKQEHTECNGKQRSPRKSRQSILFDKSPIKREISILEGRRIESPPCKSERKKRCNKRTSEQEEEDTYTPEQQRSDTNINANKLPTLFPNKNLNTNGLLTTRPCVYEKTESRDVSSNSAATSLSIFNVRPDENFLEMPPTLKTRLLSGSSHESDMSGQDSKENGTIRDSLHISTKEGDIGRSAGFFPPPSSIAKRDIASKKQLNETRPAKCDAVDILDPESGNNDGNFGIVIKSQRDRHGEMGTSLFGLNRNNSLPTISSKIKRQKKRQKREKELISLSTPILRPGAKEQVVLVNGVIGINIKGDGANDEKHLSVPEELSDITNIPRSEMCDSKETVSSVDEFSIYRLAKIDFTQPSGTISLEGQGLPAGRTITQTRLPSNVITFNTNACGTILEKTRNLSEESFRPLSCSPESPFEIYPELSRNVCDSSRLCIESIPVKPRKYQTITQIRPVLRQPPTNNNLSALNSTPRTRPINASLSASKQLEEKRKGQPLSPVMTDNMDNDIHEESVDLSICASKIKDIRSSVSSNDKEENVKNMEIRIENKLDFGGVVGYGRSESCDSCISSNSGSDYSRHSLPKHNVTELIRNPSIVAKHQGASSMNPRMDKLTKLQIVTECEQGKHEAAIKILKSLDQDMYADFTHRKHRKKNHANHNDNNPKVVTVRVRYSDNDAISETQIEEANYIVDSDNDSEIE